MTLFKHEYRASPHDTLRNSAPYWLATTKQKCADTADKIRRRSPDSHPDFLSHYSDWRNQTLRTSRDKISRGHWHSPDKKHTIWEGAYNCDEWPAWRTLGFAHEVCPHAVKHHGWYCEEECESLVQGYVLQLPTRHGIEQFVPGVSWTDCDGVTLWPLERYDEEEDAARAADRYAELIAEYEREHNHGARQYTDAERVVEESVEEIGEAHQSLRDYVRDLPSIPATCDHIVVLTRHSISEQRRRVRELVKCIREARETMEEYKEFAQ